jgi:transglycosylase-like protein with SLT domain
MPAAESDRGMVEEAAKRRGIPFRILWGVYGVETSHGEKVSTSSAGAKGGFQFIESTAKSYGYPYTNQQTNAIFAKQADVAAKYLSDLYHEHGSWEGALQAYSGGGYGYEKVKAESKYGGAKFLGTGKQNALEKANPLPEAVNAGAGAVETVEGAASTAGEVIAVITDPNTWLRVAEGIGGMVLLAMGLKTLTRGSGGGAVAEAGRQARSGHQVVKRAAEAAVIL